MESGTEYSAVLEKPTLVAVTGTRTGLPFAGNDKAGVAMALGADRLFIRLEQINGVWLRVLKQQGSTMYGPSTTFPTVRMGATFQRAIGRCVWEALLSWSAAPAAGVDSGIGFTPVDHARIVAGSLQNDGMLIGNVAGVLKFVTRGPGGYEEVDLSAYANPLDEWNQIGLMLKHPTKEQDASVTPIVNGVEVQAARRTWSAGHKLPEFAAARGSFYPQFTHAEVATYLRSLELHYYAGPDVEGL